MNIKSMKIIGKSNFEKELDKAAGKAAGQPETLEMCLKQFSEKAPEVEIGIRIYREKGLMNAGTVTVRELSDVSDIDGFIRDQYGGGRFVLEFFDGDKKPITHYSRNIDGPIKKYGAKAAEDNGDSPKSASKSFQQEIIAMLQAQNTAMLGMLTSGGDSSKFEEMMIQFMMNRMDNDLTREEGAITRASDVLTLVQQARPEIPPEDSTVALIQAFGSAVGGYMNLRAAQSNSPLSAIAGGQGAPDVKALPPGLEFLAGATPEDINKVLQSLSPEQRAQLGTKTIDPDTTSNTVELAGPGEQQPVEAGSSEVQSRSTPRIPAEHVTFEVKIQQLRADARNGAEPSALANEIIALVEASRLLTQDNPHPLLIELTQEDDPVKLQNAMISFFQKIPELADPELQKKIGLEIYAILTGEEITEDQTEQDEAGENSDELLSSTTGVPPGRDGAADTAESDATEQGEHGGIDAHEPGGNDGEGIDKPGPAPGGENLESKVA